MQCRLGLLLKRFADRAASAAVKASADYHNGIGDLRSFAVVDLLINCSASITPSDLLGNTAFLPFPCSHRQIDGIKAVFFQAVNGKGLFLTLAR